MLAVSTRAPISIGSATTRGILAGLDRARDQLGGDRVVDDDVLDDQAADERVDAGRAEWA